MLRQRSRPYLFSNTLPPPVVACASKVCIVCVCVCVACHFIGIVSWGYGNLMVDVLLLFAWHAGGAVVNGLR